MAGVESISNAFAGPSEPQVVETSRGRKRTNSDVSESPESISTFKRPRLTLARAGSCSSVTTGHSIDSPRAPRPMTPERSMFLSTFSSITTPPQNVDAEIARLRARPLSRRSSMTPSDSRPGSPGRTMVNPLEGFPGLRDRIIRPRPRNDSNVLLRRSVSAASLWAAPSSPGPQEITYAEESAKKHMQLPKFVVDFAAPVLPAFGSSSLQPSPDLVTTQGSPPALDSPPTPPIPTPDIDVRSIEPKVLPNVLACSTGGYLFFTRNNRLHFKNLMANEEVGQLCKLKESHGAFSAVACGSEENPNVVAYATTTGAVAIYDVLTKQRVMIWTTKPVTALAWNNRTLTVGYVSGAVRHYDTRQTSFPKLKDQAVLLASRHQSPITRLAWNVDGRLLASADQQGNVLCWKAKDKVPLEVGEPGQTRMKKIKHTAAISALGWCPWAAKVLVTADVKGVAQLWRLDHEVPGSDAMKPGKIDTGAAITGIQWSLQCKEFVTTHGYKVPQDALTVSSSRQLALRNQPPSATIEHSISVWQYPTARFVTSMRVSPNEVPLGNSATCASATKVVFSIPDDGKIYISDVWAKLKQHKLRRQSSLDFAGQIR